MINLLPFEQQKLVRADYWHRVYIVIFFFVTGALATLLLFLGLIYFTFLQTSAVPEQSAEQVLDTQTIEQEFKKTNEALAFFSIRDDGYAPTVLLEELITGSSNSFGVYLTEFSYKAVKKDATVLFSGSAKTRDALVKFLDHLRGKEIVESVESPIGSLSKSTDIPFSVTIHLKPYDGKK